MGSAGAALAAGPEFKKPNMPPVEAAGVVAASLGGGTGATAAFLGAATALIVGATVIATSFSVIALGSLGSNKSPSLDESSWVKKSKNPGVGAFVTGAFPAAFAAASLICCFDRVLDASTLRSAMDGLAAIIWFLTASSLTSWSNSALRLIAAADTASPSFSWSLAVGVMKALATAGGPVGFASGSPGLTKDGSLVKKEKSPPGAGAFFTGVGAGGWGTDFVTAVTVFLAIAMAGAVFSSDSDASGGVKKLNIPFDDSAAAATSGFLMGEPEGILSSDDLAASAFAEAKDGRAAIIAFFASISSGSCLNIAMFSPSGDLRTSFFTSALPGVVAGVMNAFAIAGGAVG